MRRMFLALAAVVIAALAPRPEAAAAIVNRVFEVSGTDFGAYGGFPAIPDVAAPYPTVSMAFAITYDNSMPYMPPTSTGLTVLFLSLPLMPLDEFTFEYDAIDRIRIRRQNFLTGGVEPTLFIAIELTSSANPILTGFTYSLEAGPQWGPNYNWSYAGYTSLTFTDIPEPHAMALFALALCLLAGSIRPWRRRHLTG